jgi:site-specific DNA recombinase
VADQTIKRCAIYTRKSSEEGLEQEYNSLDAQRDAGDAFIRSQKHEGWRALEVGYDDGGISGGHMERPGLQRMLRDVAAGKIDVVVVYKVDRLSRSLADFSQLMQLFDKHGVSFVSVTQQFNTSTSMGRLTLNVLLSFAQFEREVTGERIRDKIELSKKKGMWMGGYPLLGYDSNEGKLKINPEEAKTVLACFETYLATDGLISAVNELNRRGYQTKRFVSSKGRVLEPKPWVAKQLHRVLTQPIYKGMIHHRGELYPGEHEAIVTEALWERAQKKLKENQPGVNGETGHLNEQLIKKTKLIHPLKGFVQCIEGFALTPTYTNKSCKRANGTKERLRYRYYVSQQAIRRGYEGLAIRTLNAELLEESVKQILVGGLPLLGRLIVGEQWSEDQIQARLKIGAESIGKVSSAHDFGRVMELLSPKVVVSKDSIQVHVFPEGLLRLLQSPLSGGGEVSTALTVEMVMRDGCAILSSKVSLERSRGHTRIFDGETGEAVSVARTEPKASLIQALTQGEFWRMKLMENPDAGLTEVVKPYGLKPEYVRRLLNFAYLAPDIKRAIMQGEQPTMMRLQDVLEMREMAWERQREILGFERIDRDAVA